MVSCNTVCRNAFKLCCSACVTAMQPGRGVGDQGRTDHLETRALPKGPGSVGGPMRCPWYLFHRLF
ncbi:unnamed protein product [Staurois parvus]|uniref:Uncharacterized protein n=1 Tax=Staurois parvus TaxID=386267 RepID=A0ABN9F3Y5_9NEOB|nr:unnamed protein product [Staurois parvus]